MNVPDSYLKVSNLPVFILLSLTLELTKEILNPFSTTHVSPLDSVTHFE